MTNDEVKQLVFKVILENPTINTAFDLSSKISFIERNDIDKVLSWLEDDGLITLDKKYVHGITYNLNKS